MRTGCESALVAIMVAAMSMLTQAVAPARNAVDWTSRRRMKRIGENLAPNPSFNGPNGWDYSIAGEPDKKQSLYDEKVSRTLGSGSVRLFNAAVKGWKTDAIHNSVPIRVEPGQTYTFAVYIKTDSWPPPVAYLYASYSPLSLNPPSYLNLSFRRRRPRQKRRVSYNLPC